MKYRLKIAEQDFNHLKQLVLSDYPREAGAFALAGIGRHTDLSDVLIRRVISIPRNEFVLQHELRLEISSGAINGLIALCDSNGLGAVLCHSHPSDSSYSPSDDQGERRVLEVLRNFIPASAPTASLLFSPSGVRGRVWLPGSTRPVPFSEIMVVGRHLRYMSMDTGTDGKDVLDTDLYDRQIRAFGRDGQALISKTKVGIVGMGGTGSVVAEQLVRLGVNDLVLIDPDVFEASNITRMYGTYLSDIRLSKWQFWKKRTN